MGDINSDSIDPKENDLYCESRIQINSYDIRPSSPSSSSSDYITEDADNNSDSKETVPLKLKSVENMLSVSKHTTKAELQDMVNSCKMMVLESTECSDERKWLVRRLIELRLRLQEIQESFDKKLFEIKLVQGHHFVPQKYYIATTNSVFCDQCSRLIWIMLQSWYKCNDCNYCCHWKCLSNVCRLCVHVTVSETGGYTNTMDICPEQSLSKQCYRCAECRTHITFNTSKEESISCFGKSKNTEAAWIEPRLCDYNGRYYCHKCHWNTAMVIPARVIRNWDIEPRLVSRVSAQALKLLENRPVLQLEKLNPQLFTLVPDLSLMKRMREEMQMMKKYLVLCIHATVQGLPWKTNLRPHMIESSSNYSIKDLVDLQNNVLLDELRITYDAMQTHITKQCKLCKARGHLCEMCGNDDIIFPWDANSVICKQCSAVHHRVCWFKRNQCCPKCTRLEKRSALEKQVTESVEDHDMDDITKKS